MRIGGRRDGRSLIFRIFGALLVALALAGSPTFAQNFNVGRVVVVASIAGPFLYHGCDPSDPWLYYVDEPARAEHYPTKGRTLEIVEPAREGGGGAR